MDEPRQPNSGVDFVALPAGQAIGRYEVVSVLGHGGFGITYRARDSLLGREVAIKEYLPPALAVRQDSVTVLPRSPREVDDFTWGRARFVDEGRTLGGLQKAPAIVRVYDFLEANGTAYIVMELVHGETLEHRLKHTGPVKPAEIDRLLWPLLDGLSRVHAAGFLHRDIKPANILLDADGDPTLIDFGASRAAMADRTSAMTAVFTPGYAAAEQISSAKQGPWTDIYALSATLYHAIAGEPPPNVFDRMMDDAYQPLARLRPPGFAPGLLVGIDAGLAVRAGDRPQTIEGWRALLTQDTAARDDATVVSRGASVRPAGIARPAGASGRSRVRPAVTALVALAVVAAGYVAWDTSDTRQADRLAAQAVRDATERQAVEAARLKAEADEAEKVRQAEALKKAEADRAEAARAEAAKVEAAKAEAERAEAARVEAERMQAEAAERRRQEDERKAAEAGEAALRLGLPERQKLQIALTAAGFDTRGSDGTFGPRSREMIAAWQKARNQPATGFLTAAQNQSLLREGAAALAKLEEEKKKAEDDRKKLDEEAKARAPVVAPFDGSYAGAFTPSGTVGPTSGGSHAITLRVAGNDGAGTMVSARCGSAPITIRISAAGDVTGEASGLDASCSRFPLAVQGRVANGRLQLTFSGAAGRGTATLLLGASAPAPLAPVLTPPPAAWTATGTFDGSYAGSINSINPGGPSRILGADLQVAGGRLSGQIVSPTCGNASISLAVSPGGEISGEARLQENATCSPATLSVTGRVSGDRLTLDMRGAGLRMSGSLTKRGG
ncbi:MAG: hypothetical protein EPO67_23800 [Reyranella sp.]|nr:MAG: hypothetical protein EPO67_23800 [Reyranella sp.]